MLTGMTDADWTRVVEIFRKRYEEHGSEWLLTAPACGAVFLQQAR